jgi:hypothetical protein
LLAREARLVTANVLGIGAMAGHDRHVTTLDDE